MTNKALFLDRDGVVNVDKDYVFRIEDFEFIDGIFDLCRSAVERGYLIVVITNQSGIGRGYYGEEDFHALTDWMKRRFEEQGAPIAAVYYCPDHPEHGQGRYRVDSFDRKPNPGMILRAVQDLDLDLSASIMVGDRASDMKAADTAGIGRKVLFSPAGGGDIISSGADEIITRLDEVFGQAIGHKARHSQ